MSGFIVHCVLGIRYILMLKVQAATKPISLMCNFRQIKSMPKYPQTPSAAPPAKATKASRRKNTEAKFCLRPFAPASSILAMSSGVRTAVKRSIRSEKDCKSFQNKAVDEPRFPAAIYPSSLYFFVLILAVD